MTPAQRDRVARLDKLASDLRSGAYSPAQASAEVLGAIAWTYRWIIEDIEAINEQLSRKFGP